MPSQSRFNSSGAIASGIAVVVALGLFSQVGLAQGNRDRNYDRITRLDPGMTITVRVNDQIGGDRADYRVYAGVVERDVRGQNQRVAIPRGSTAELIVRAQRDGDLIVDLESVSVNGQRYAVDTATVGIDTDQGRIGSVVGRVRGGAYRGRSVRIPRGTVMGFRLERALTMDVADRGVMRDGQHYHDWYGRGRQ
jgi:hypothetical protein